jgi:hypothetical protein
VARFQDAIRDRAVAAIVVTYRSDALKIMVYRLLANLTFLLRYKS